MKIRIASQNYNLDQEILLMAILNVTPDSFSDGGKFLNPDSILQLIDQCNQNHVDIIDVGGESSRPGSEPVSLDEELERTIPVIELIRNHSNCHISIDTTKSQVAKSALKAGAVMVNDISAGRQDPEILSIAAEYESAFVLMHMQGQPKTMQENPQYTDLFSELTEFYKERIDTCQRVGLDQLIIDPGIGFGKTFAHNFQLINGIGKLSDLNQPILIGASRKAFLAGPDNLQAAQRETATVIVHSQAILNGARLVRTHDVISGRRMINVCSELLANR
ncbi:MAG: dihydropteroate synthase [Calditrichaeota bacterium]|nr:dihydropteroate synthase [Calditrichota bacterium]